MERRPRVLLGSTGSVASIKVAALCRLLLEFADVKLVVTSSAKHFINEEDLPEAVKPILGDEAEWRQWRAVGDPVMHIDLRRWADVLLVAPLSANSLAKMANGMADNLLTCVVRAWDFAAKPLLVAPAMNTAMWASPFTSRHLDTLAQLGSSVGNSGGSSGSGGDGGSCSVAVVAPVSKRLACGDEGTGAMASPEAIAAACRVALQRAGLLLQELQPAAQQEPVMGAGAEAAVAAVAVAAAGSGEGVREGPEQVAGESEGGPEVAAAAAADAVVGQQPTAAGDGIDGTGVAAAEAEGGGQARKRQRRGPERQGADGTEGEAPPSADGHG